MPADQGIIDSVSTDNIKTVAGSGALALAQLEALYVQSVSDSNVHRVRMNSYAELAFKQALAESTVSLGRLYKSDEEASFLGDLSSIAAGGIAGKQADSQPPETGQDIAQLLQQLSAGLAALNAAISSQAQNPPAKPVA
jgi:hypothetical protein